MYTFDLKRESLSFGKMIVDLYKHLTKKREFILSKQVLRSGTSIGANLREAKYGYSKKDFLYKCSISLKEAVETEYWFELLQDGGYTDEYSDFHALQHQLNQLIKVLVTTMNSTRKALNRKNY